MIVPTTLIPPVLLAWFVGRRRRGFRYGGLAYVAIEAIHLVWLIANGALRS